MHTNNHKSTVYITLHVCTYKVVVFKHIFLGQGVVISEIYKQKRLKNEQTNCLLSMDT